MALDLGGLKSFFRLRAGGESKGAEDPPQSPCEELRRRVLDDATIRFMFENIDEAGCPLNIDNISCRKCDKEGVGGGFSPTEGIILCEDRLLSQDRVNETVVHEMIHAFDHCRAVVDWSDPVQLACSEIRAANLSGDCRWWNEVRRGNYDNIKGQHQECVRRRAALSVAASSTVSTDEEAAAAVAAAWDKCFKDTAPFNRIP